MTNPFDDPFFILTHETGCRDFDVLKAFANAKNRSFYDNHGLQVQNVIIYGQADTLERILEAEPPNDRDLTYAFSHAIKEVARENSEPRQRITRILGDLMTVRGLSLNRD